jgi:histidine kinase
VDIFSKTIRQFANKRVELLVSRLPIIILDGNSFEVLDGNHIFIKHFNEFSGKTCHFLLCQQNEPCSGCPVPWVIESGKSFDYQKDGTQQLLILPISGKEYQKKLLVVMNDFETFQDRLSCCPYTACYETKSDILTIATDRLQKMNEMASGLAHELNQPLMGVRGLAEHVLLALQNNWNMPEQKMIIKMQHIIEQTDRISRLIEHMREFTRKAIQPETRRIQVNQVIESALGLFGAQLKSRGIRIETKLALDLPRIRINPFSLEEAISQLVSNAANSFHEQEDRNDLALVVLESRQEEDRVVVEVKDNGEGIPRESLSRVMEPFYTTRDPGQGVGLGLPLVQAIVEQSAGSLQIKSHQGRGTCVSMSFTALS